MLNNKVLLSSNPDEVPAYLKEADKTSKRFKSRYTPEHVFSRLLGTLIRVFDRYTEANNPEKSGDHPFYLGVLDGRDTYLAELPIDENHVHAVLYNSKDGTLKGGIYHPADKTMERYIVSRSNQDGSAVLLAMLPAMLADSEFSDYMHDYQAMKDAEAEVSTFLPYLFVLCSNVQYRIEGAGNAASIPCELDAKGTTERLTIEKLRQFEAEATEIIGTFPPVLSKAAAAAAAVSKAKAALKSFSGGYADKSRKLTSEEEEMVPILDEGYVLPKEAVSACEHIRKSTGKRSPIRNLLLRGPAGTGKTAMARAVAAGLHLPYCKLTCNANTEIFDLLGQLFPDTDSKNTDSENRLDISKLDVEGIVYDPIGTYYDLTGKEDESITPNDCFAYAVSALLESRKNSDTAGKAQTYHYVESDLIRAMRNGWVVEIQEPTTITQPGVLVGLNSLLEPNGSVTLPNGEIIHRHPDCVVIMTTNSEYEGCRGMNQSVIDRCNLIMDIEDLSADVMAERAMSATGFEDEAIVRQMVGVIRIADNYLKEQCITDGCIGMRGLIDWIDSYEITGNAYESALLTIISRATSNAEDRKTLISVALAPIFDSGEGTVY